MDDKYKDLPFMLDYRGAYLVKEDILELYKKLSNDGKIDLKNFNNLKLSLYKKKYMIKTGKSSRLATKEEVQKAVYGVYYDKESILSFYTTKYIALILDYIITGKSYETSINKNKLIEVYEYMFTDKFISDLHTIKSSNQPKFYEKNTDTDNCELMIDVLKVIREELDPDFGTDYSKKAFSIAKYALKNKSYILSKSQFSIIEIEYKKIKNKNNSISLDILDKARKIKSDITRNSSYSNMIYDIACQAIEKNYLSEKQKKLLLEYKEVKKAIEPAVADTPDDIPDFDLGSFDWN